MSDTRENHSMPPGLKVQIVLAIILTAAALLLPTALSANSNGASGRSAEAGVADVSAGSVSTTTRDFDANGFPAAAFTDWER